MKWLLFKKAPFWGLLTLLVFMLMPVSASADRNTDEVYLAPGWGKLKFDAPEAGTYELPVIRSAADGTVLTRTGEPSTLWEVMDGKVALLSFVYRTCDDVNGCPLSTMVLDTIGREFAKDEALDGRLQLMTLSFDPEFDTPEVMDDYGHSIMGKNTMDWAFLTTESDQQIAPILKAYEQTVVRDRNSKPGQPSKFSHILRVYLIDAERNIRNIYSLSFLHADILINDVKTLLMESGELTPQQ